MFEELWTTHIPLWMALRALEASCPPSSTAVARAALLPKDRRGPARDSIVLIASPPSIAKCPPIDEWIKKMWYIYTMEYYSAVKNEIMSICSNMYGIRVYHSKSTKRKINAI